MLPLAAISYDRRLPQGRIKAVTAILGVFPSSEKLAENMSVLLNTRAAAVDRPAHVGDATPLPLGTLTLFLKCNTWLRK